VCYYIVYYYSGAQWYEQFLQVGCLDWALILLGLALYHPSASVSSIFIVNFFNYIFFLYLFSELSLLGLALDVVD